MGHKEDLLVGAKRALLEKGYARTTARDIVALSGTNLGSIGYHYGSTEALMTAAMISAMEDWGDKITLALTAPPGGGETGQGEAGEDQLIDFWRRVIGSIREDRALWMASIEVAIQAEHNPRLREQLAEGVEMGRRGMASLITGVPEDQLDDETVRTLGAVQMALMSGILTQWFTDPRNAPGPEQIVAGIRALAARATPSPA